MSAGIASLDLVLDSPAVIIGAMLIAPLMSAIIGMGLAIVQGDLRFLLSATGATLRGALIAVATGLVIGLFYLDQTGTGEMLGRTQPTLMDLLVAVLSGVAATYALCRKNVSASLPRVAIAVALVPPLATVGLFLGMREFALAYGALLLFLTNLAAIVFSSGMVFAMLGCKPLRAQDQRAAQLDVFQKSFLVTSLLVLYIFTHLSVLSIEEIAESNIENTVELELQIYLEKDHGLKLISWSVDDNDKGQPRVSVHVASELNRPRSEVVDKIARALESRVEIILMQAPAHSVRSTKGIHK